MDTLKVNPKNNKVLFFSDLHLGVHQNSQIWHNIVLKLAKWIRLQMEENSLDTIFFAGDVFHDRHEIGVNTLHVAKKFFSELSDYKIYLIPGNHDAYLSTSTEINSVDILSNKNIYVFSSLTTVQVSDKIVSFCPWKTDIEQLPESDMVIGHFDLINFKMNSNKVCDHGEDSQTILAKTKAIVTGHFHLRDYRQYNDKYVLYLGSPYEMDFGDRGQQKGVSIIDFEDLSIKFVINDITPKHYRIKISEILQKQYTNLEEIVANNIISLYVDTKIDTLTLDLLIAKLTQYKPLQFRTEFNILDTAQIDVKETKKLSIDIETAFEEFIEQLDNVRCSKKAVLDKCIELYKLHNVV